MKSKLLSEYLGTFFLIFFGTGAIIVNEESGTGVIGHSGIAAAFGLSVFFIILLFGNSSGAHLNPAVTIGVWLNKKMVLTDGVYYILAQITGAVSASLLLHFLFPANDSLGTTFPKGGILVSVVLEFILTFILMLAILRITAQENISLLATALCIGGIIGLEALVAGPICGASMNPARSLAPAIVSGSASNLWIYIIAPIAGSAVAVFINQIFNSKTP